MTEHDRDRGAPAARARQLRQGGADNDTGAAFTLTRGELSALVRGAVSEALAQGGRELLIDKQILADRLGCSVAHVDNLRKRGLPTVLVGQSVRFEPGAVVAWLREHSAPPGAGEKESEP